MLLSRQVGGCSVEARNNAGETPLYVACLKGHVDAALFLGRDQARYVCMADTKVGLWTVPDGHGVSPMHVCCAMGHAALARHLHAAGILDLT